MTHSHEAAASVRRRGWARTRAARGLALLAPLCLALGCNSLSMLPRDKPAPPKKDTTPAPAAPAIPVKPSRYCFRVAPYVFLSDFEIKGDQPLFKDLARLRDQVYKELRLPPGDAVVEVYLFEDEDHYQRFMEAKYPNLPHRRAFFLAQPRWLGGPEDLLVYTFWSERIQQDLRHELTHALVHSVIQKVPLWLDEGLAEFFELPRERNGLNPGHVEQLRRAMSGILKPDLSRLEAFQDEDLAKMGRIEYQESWAWVHLMLRSGPEARNVLLTYLAQLRANKVLGPLRARLALVFPSPEDALEKHLARLDASATPEPRAER